MNFKSLVAFQTVAQCGTASGAAEKMGLSQPAISRLIAQLERDIGLALFERQGRKLILSEHGQAFLREAVRIMKGVQDIPGIAAAIRHDLPSTLRIVAMPRVASGWVAPAVARFRSLNPRANLRIDIQQRQYIESWLAGRHYDIGIGALPTDHSEIETVPILRARACAFVAANHPLASRRKISAAELMSHPLIGPTPGLLQRDQIDDIFRAAGLTARFEIETSTSGIACTLAAQGCGILITDRLSAAGETAKLVALPIEPARSMAFGLLMPRQTLLGELAMKLRDCLESTACDLARRPGFELVRAHARAATSTRGVAAARSTERSS
jgi:DNA-binding transcriptional LysR family regulator